MKISKIKLNLNKINPILNFIPNIALNDVPIGKDEKSNKELKVVGEIPQLDFKESHMKSVIY